jgi:hypothetical protein
MLSTNASCLHAPSGLNQEIQSSYRVISQKSRVEVERTGMALHKLWAFVLYSAGVAKHGVPELLENTSSTVISPVSLRL